MIHKDEVTTIINERIRAAEQEILQQADNHDVIEQMNAVIWELDNVKDAVERLEDLFEKEVSIVDMDYDEEEMEYHRRGE